MQKAEPEMPSLDSSFSPMETCKLCHTHNTDSEQYNFTQDHRWQIYCGPVKKLMIVYRKRDLILSDHKGRVHLSSVQSKEATAKHILENANNGLSN